MITLSQYWMGRDKMYARDLTDAIIANAMVTVQKANALLDRYEAITGDHESRHVTSGWRPPALNAQTPNAAARSKHMTGQAIDLSDPESDLDEWCLDHPDVLEEIGFWQEHPSATKGWAHFQTVPPKSGKRVFYP